MKVMVCSIFVCVFVGPVIFTLLELAPTSVLGRESWYRGAVSGGPAPHSRQAGASYDPLDTHPDTSLSYREDFDSGDIDWTAGWDTDHGRSRYKDRYRIDRLRGGFLVRDRRSYYSRDYHDYFKEQILQIVKPYRENGFWDADRGNWVCRLLWDRERGWYDRTPHDWKYSIELEEGALMAAMITGTRSMDSCLAGELRYIHSRLGDDGRFDGFDIGLYGYEYGVTLSALALGARHFMNHIGHYETARTAFTDMTALYVYIASNWKPPGKPTPEVNLLLRGFVNAARSFREYGEKRYAEAAARKARDLAYFITINQDPSGRFNIATSLVESYPVQNQLKADIALMLAYRLIGDKSYPEAVRRNIDWVIANRSDVSGKCMGGLCWNTSDKKNFFECHQMWFLIAAKYLEEETGCDYSDRRADAVAFLTDDNFAGVDMYVHNLETYGAFFAYRAISNDGTIQRDASHQFKGAYEIGASLWGMALHYDEWNEGHSWLVTQSPPDRYTHWEMAIYSQRRFDAVHMMFQYDVKFEDVTRDGAYTGLFADTDGTWLVAFDTDAGLHYWDERGRTVVVVGRSVLNSRTRYTVRVSKSHVNTIMLELLEEGIPLYRGDYVTAAEFNGFHFGALQMINESKSAKNVYIDNIHWVGGLGAPMPVATVVNVPNPFNAQTTIEFTVEARGVVTAEIFDIRGAVIKRLFDGAMKSGPHRLLWDCRNDRGWEVASGIYFFVLKTGGSLQTKKLVLIR
jgi:hypothetical protein